MSAGQIPLAASLLVLAQLPYVGPATLAACRDHPDPAWIVQEVVDGRGHLVAELATAVEAARRRARRDGRDLPAEQVGAAMARAAAGIDPIEELDRHAADGRRVFVSGEPGYPGRLADDPAPPAVLLVEGDTSVLDGPVVAIVGTRNATRAGRASAAALAVELARVGVSIVSGLALGIDGAAHQGLLDAGLGAGGGRPIGVVASGLDITYPAAHARLHRDVNRHGVLLSETPLGIRPTTWRFPARNRIIAGLADAVVVVESRATGGSILTAGEAVSRNVPVLAVPGHPTAPASAGTNDLIADGAIIARDVEDVLVAIGLGGARDASHRRRRAGEEGAVADPAERAVLDALGVEPLGLDEVLDRTGLSLADGSVALAALTEAGRIERRGSWFERAEGSSGRPSVRPGSHR